MPKDKIGIICQNYYRKFKKTKGNVSLDDLLKLAKKEALKAKRNYPKLIEPKTCSLPTYIALWVRESLEAEFTLKTLRKVDLKNPGQDAHAQSLASFFYFLPLELIPHLQKKIFDAPFPKRKKIWQSFGLPIKKIENEFKNLAKTRNKEAIEKNYSSFLNYFLERNKISRKVYSQFINNIDQLIKSLNQQLPEVENLPPWFYSEFNLPCFVCRFSSFPFDSLAGVFDFVAKEYSVLQKLREKIRFKIAGDSNFTVYRKEKDFFEINIEKGVNIRHQALFLTHELGHVIAHLNNFAKDIDLVFEKGRCGSEKEAIKIEINLLKKASHEFYQASLGEVLLFIFRKTLFEIEIYKNPNQDLNKLYAQTFNRCFLKAKQKDNPLYVLDKQIITRPFYFLPHAVAYYHLLSQDQCSGL